ncbi:unnamed protein product [Scytosiphon promiscuus]
MGGGGLPRTDSEGNRRAEGLPRDENGIDLDAETAGGGGEEGREGQPGGGLLRDILRELFDSAATAGATISTAAPATTGDASNPFCEESLLASTVEAPNDLLNPLAGSWSPSRRTHDRSRSGGSPNGASTRYDYPETNPDKGEAAAAQQDSHGARRLRFEDVENGEGTDDEERTMALLERQTRGIDDRTGRTITGRRRDAQGFSRSVEGGFGFGRPPVVALSAWEVSGKNVTDLFVCPTRDSGLGGTSSTATGNPGAPRNSDDSGKNRRGSRSRSRNRGKKGKATGEGARGDEVVGNGSNGSGRRRNSRGRSGSDDSSAAGEGWPTGYPEDFLAVRAPDFYTALELVHMAQRRRSTGLSKGAEATAEKGHVFFRVVVYNAEEETVSTLHVVDLAGGWEPPMDKPAGRRGSKGSGAASARPSATSREWNSFDAMLTGLAPSPPPPGGALDDATAVATCTSVPNDGECGGCRTSSLGSTVDKHEESACATVVPDSGPQTSMRPPPQPRPHPVFGSPKGKSFGGGGGGKLVEALQPLISGNTRTWLVVSVGGEGQGGAGAAWRALDVARAATAICTTCIRLRGVSLDDLRLRSAKEVLIGDAISSTRHSTNGSNVVFSSVDPGVSDRRVGRVGTPAYTTPTKTATATPSARPSLGDTEHREGRLTSPESGPSGQKRTIFGTPGTGTGGESLSSPGLSLLGLADGEDLLSLASMSFGEEVRGGDRSGSRRGVEGAANGYLDDFLAGFEGVAAAWHTLTDTAADKEHEEESGGSGSGGGVRSGARGLESGPASLDGNFTTISSPEGQPRRQQQHRAPLRQGSSLRPGGRAAAVGTTPSVRIVSEGGPPEAVASATCNGIGSVRGVKYHYGNGSAAQKSTVGGTVEGNKIGQSAALNGATADGDATLRSGGAGNVSPGASRARENIDRMMSSLLEDVLPNRREVPPSRAVLGSAGEGRNTGNVGAFVPVAAGRSRSAAADNQDARTRRSSPNNPTLPTVSSPPPATKYSENPTPAVGGTPESKDNSGVFLTPIEVIMHAPAGGCGSTDVRVGGCRRCAASAETRTGGTAAHTVQRQQEVAATSVGGNPLVHVLGEGQVGKAGRQTTNERVSASNTTANGSSVASSRHVLSGRGDRQVGASDGGDAERDYRDLLKQRKGSEAIADRNTDDSEEQIASRGGEEAELLRRNHAALLRVIREQGEREKQVQRRFEDKERDWLERVTTLEAGLEGLRAEKVETRGRLRRAEASSPSSEVFERYEAHAGLLEAENTSLRDQNVALEMKLLDVLEHSNTSARPESTRTTASANTGYPDIAGRGKEIGRHRQPATSAPTPTKRPADEEKTGDWEQEAESDVPLHPRTFETKAFRLDADAPKSRREYSAGDRGITSRYRVDGRVAPSACAERVAGSHPGGGVAISAAVLKDLRRRLKEVELEAKEMRAERAAVEKRDRLCQAQLRTLTEQRAKVRELFLREKEHEAQLTASRLESARAEAIAKNEAAEIERLRDHQASLAADREALVLALAEERRKSRLFEEDRRAYGHIRRFIERHAGGRPAEWDANNPPTGRDEEGPIFHGAERERRQRHGVRRSGKDLGMSETIGALRGGGQGEELDETIFGLSGLTNGESSGEEIRRFDEATRQEERPHQRPTSAPRRYTRTVNEVSADRGCLDDSSGYLYSDLYRNKLSARLDVGHGTSVRGGIPGYDRDEADRGAPLRRERSTEVNRRSDDCSSGSPYRHHALNFRVSQEEPRAKAARAFGDRQNVPLKTGSIVKNSRRNGGHVVDDDEWAGDAYATETSGIGHNRSAPYGRDSFATSTGEAARKASATNNARQPPPPRVWRGTDHELEAERRLERRFTGASASSTRLSGSGAASAQASVVFGATADRRVGTDVRLEDASGRTGAERRRRDATQAAEVSSGLHAHATDRHFDRAWLA